MKYYLMIYTPYGDRYKVDLMTGNFVEHGAIGKSSNPILDDRWTLHSFVHVKRNDRISLEWIQAHPSVVDSIHWTWKNGNPQWTVGDVDCGTYREWGNTKVHGVCNVRLIEEKDNKND